VRIYGLVASGDCSPEAPADPDVRNYRIRLFGPRLRYVTVAGMSGFGSGTLEQPIHYLPRHPSPLRAAIQPLAPHARDLMAKIAEHSQLPMRANYPKWPNNLCPSAVHCSPTGSCRYCRHHSAVRLRVRRKRSAAVFCYHPKSLVGYGPVVGEARQVEVSGRERASPLLSAQRQHLRFGPRK
jgi:hypothetical protein